MSRGFEDLGIDVSGLYSTDHGLLKKTFDSVVEDFGRIDGM